MFQLENLIKKYNGVEVLSIPDMQIEEGQICCVSGPNGSGKTTFLELLAGLQTPTSGQVLFHGKPVTEAGRGKIIMVLQNPVMFNTTVYSNLAFGLKIKGIPSKAHEPLITAALKLVGMEQYKKQNANNLSGGEKQRVAIARALVLEPDVLIMDEPTAGLDVPARDALIDIVKGIYSEKKLTCIIASHDKDFLLSLATTAFSLIRGKHAPMSVENFFHGTVIDNGVVRIQNGVQFYAPTDREGNVNAVIAPENIVLSRELLESSMRNRFKGFVTRLEKDGEKVKVTMDIGIDLCSTITPRSVQEMRITIGDQLWLEFKATSVKVY